jgi:hypothetical protein
MISIRAYLTPIQPRQQRKIPNVKIPLRRHNAAYFGASAGEPIQDEMTEVVVI